MQPKNFSDYWHMYTDKPAADRQQLCSYATAFQTAARQGLANAFQTGMTDTEREAVKKRLKALADTWQQRLPVYHFPSLGGTHICIEEVYQEVLVYVETIPPPPPPAPPHPVREPTLAEKKAIVVGYIEDAGRA